MPKVDLFCEDSFHAAFVSNLVRRFAFSSQSELDLRSRSATHGLPGMKASLKQYLKDLDRDRGSLPDAVIVVVDANCLGYNARKNEMESVASAYEKFSGLLHYAIPDPHIERWMLVDPAAFAAVFGRGCTLPKVKCARDEYKRLLRDEIRRSGREALLGGREYAEDIVANLNLATAQREPSLRLFLQSLKSIFG